MIMLGQTFREPLDSDGDGTSDAPATPFGVAPRKSAVVMASVLALVVAGLAPAYAALIDDSGNQQIERVFAVPDVLGGWRRVDARGPAWRPVVKGADAEAIATFEKNGKTVSLFLAYFTYQRQGSELIGSGHRLIGSKKWSRVSSATRGAHIGPEANSVMSTRIQRHPVSRIVWHWYWVDDRYTANPYVAKLLELKVRLLGGNPAAGIFVIATDYVDTPREAVPVLEAFLASISPITVIGPALPSEGDGEPTLQANSAETEMDG